MRAIAVLTNRGIGRLLDEGGSKNWVLDPKRASRIPYVVCIQNRISEEWGDPTHAHGQAFLIGKISGVSFTKVENGKKRYIIEFDEYAEIDLPNFWQAWRNPVKYIDLEKHSIDPTKLTFKTNARKKVVETTQEPPQAAPSVPVHDVEAMDMAEAKQALATYYGVPVGSIEITIRG